MATTNIFNKLTKVCYGAQDYYKNNQVENHKLKDCVITEIPYNLVINNNFYKKLEFSCPKDRYFNLLKFKLNKPFNDVFEEIAFYIGGQKIMSVDNVEYLEIIKKLKGTYEDDGEYIYLPFLFENNKMYNQKYHTIEIELKTKVFLFESDIKLFGTTYKRDVTIINENFENNIIQLQKQPEILLEHKSWYNYFFGTETKQVKINLMFKHPVFAIYILGKGIKNIKLQLSNIVYETTLTNLLETNKKNGYDFNFPIIIFEPSLFFDKNSKTINFSRIDEQKLTIEYTDGKTNVFKVYAINFNLLRSSHEMSGLGYAS